MGNKRKWSLGFAITVAVISIAGVWLLILPAILRPREVSSLNACIALLRQIDGAKQTWALENHKIPTDVPTEADLFGPDKYIREKEPCPQGGIHTIGSVKNKPTCSIPHHTL